MGTALSEVGTSTSARVLPRTSKPADVEIALAPTALADALPRRLENVEVVLAERSERISRLANIVIAVLGLVAMAPVIALVALAVRLTSRGPILYSQVRVGLDRRTNRTDEYDRRAHDCGGRLFKMYKFRSMRVDAEADGKAVWAQRADPRTTPLGMFLRRTRLDELPQLYNVIRGDMNIVGPRPERPSIFAELCKEIPVYAQRQRVKPGITGWAQINQAYDSCLNDVQNKVKLDLEYVRSQSLAKDLRIMSLTVPVMLLRKGGW
jgi:lipopolysaccharide/colanic/teichoic acid biosynthesis glycosyltransferase